MKVTINRYSIIALFLALVSMSSCTKFADPAPEFEEWELGGDTTVKRKVLVIGVDALVGSQIKKYAPTNIAKLMQKSKYTFDSKSDLNTSNVSSWATLLTGQPSSVHHVTAESFIAEPDPDHPHDEIGFNPSLIYRIERTSSRIKTASVVRNLNMSNILLSTADYPNVEDSDVKVKDRTIDLLTDNNPDFVFAQFSGLLAAGQNGGYTVDNPNYKSALDQVDTYIGELVNKIESSSTYAKENWLIVITSPHGGSETGTIGGLSDNEINTFGLFYNKSFKPLELKADAMTYFNATGYTPGTYNYYGTTNRPRKIEEMGVRAQSPAGAASNIFNASTLASKSITYDFKFRLKPEGFWSTGYSFTYNMFLGKDLSEGRNKGWNLYSTGGTNFAFLFQDGTNEISVPFSRGADGSWHHYTFTYAQASATTTLVNVYVDGVLNATQTINMALTAFENQEPLTIGFTPITNFFAIPNYDIADLRVWKRSLISSEVSQIACTPVIATENPLYNDLLASYRGFSGNTWKNLITGSAAPDFTLSGEPSISFGKNFTVCKENADAIYVQSIDLFPQVFYWLNLQVNEEWNIPGQEFLNDFLAEFWED